MGVGRRTGRSTHATVFVGKEGGKRKIWKVLLVGGGKKCRGHPKDHFYEEKLVEKGIISGKRTGRQLLQITTRPPLFQRKGTGIKRKRIEKKAQV